MKLPSREAFDEAVAGSLRKWEAGKSQTLETFPEWWYNTGKEPCLLCDFIQKNFRNVNCSYMCQICPLNDYDEYKTNTCIREWSMIHKQMNDDHPDITECLKFASDLYDRIKNLKYKDFIELFKEYGGGIK
jgi:hypothetical protein